MRWLLLLALSACLNPASVPCGDGDLCPPGTECRAVTNPDQKLCASPDQIAQCTGKPDYTRCLTNGRCYFGVCLSIACGNGRVDKADPNDPMDIGENCDDHNQTSGDGCSADCLSDETCGNGYLDPIVGEQCDDHDNVDHDGCDSTCRGEQPRWTQMTFGPPSQRIQYSMAYDAARGTTVLFGGADPTTGDLLADTWEWNGNGWRLIPTIGGPSPRADAAMTYDAEHRVVVLYGGGTVGGLSSETWLWNGTTWSAVVTTNSPGRRANHVMAYDSARKRTVLFSGLVDVNYRFSTSNATWEWDGTSWSQMMPATTPIAEHNGAMAYDPERGVMVAFGGIEKTDTSVWEYDGTNWHEIAKSGTWPETRMDHALAWSPTLHRVIMFGGTLATGDTADTWSWNGQVWTKLTTPPALVARAEMRAVTDWDRQRIVMWGGDVADADTWEWSTAWQDQPSLTIAGQAGNIAYDSHRGRTVLFDTKGKQTFEFDGIAWLAPATGALQPDPGAFPSVAYDEAHRQVVLFGGNAFDSHTWLYDGSAWTSLAVPGPSPRAEAAMAYDSTRHKLVLFGGNNTNDFSDTWEWDGSSWTQVSTPTSPPARQSAAMGYDPLRKQIVLFGGGITTYLNDTWTFDGTTWTEHTIANPPSARAGGRMAWYAARERLVLFAGLGPQEYANDAWEWTGTTWQLLPLAPVPTTRAYAGLFPLPDGGLGMFGGLLGFSINQTRFDDTWRLRWEGAGPADTCRDTSNDDGDKLAGCADGDCALVCTECGDGTCSGFETCRNCPGDCTCQATCGDAYCDAPETHATCPGDCP